MKLPETEKIIVLAIVFVFASMSCALIFLTIIHPTEFKDYFRQILGALLAAVIGYNVGANKNKPS